MKALAHDNEVLRPRPDVFRYHDYRKFLKDWCDYLKATRPGFSIRALSREAELGSGYLSMVFYGQRNLSSKVWLKISPLLGLSTQETAFLGSLRIVEETSSPVVKFETFSRLQKFRAYRESNPKEALTYRYLSHWYFVAIRELAFLPGFQLDPKWIQERLIQHVPLNEIKEAVDFLLEHGLLVKDPNGTVSIPEKNIECHGDVFRMALGNFHREMLTLAKSAIGNVEFSKRSVTGHTLAIDQKDYEKVKGILDEALMKLSKLEASKDSNAVYHVTLAAFPLSSAPMDGGNDENNTDE